MSSSAIKQFQLKFPPMPPRPFYAAQHNGDFVGIYGIVYFLLFFGVAASAFQLHGIPTTLAVAIIGIFGFWGPTNKTYRKLFFGDRSLSKTRVAIGALANVVVVMIVTDFRLSVLQYLVLVLACGALYFDFVRKQDAS